MNWKRIGRAALCLLVVCCIIFNCISTPSKALVLADDIALGITALLLLAAAGMVIVPQSSVQISDVGESFRLSLYQWGTSAEKLDEVDEFINAFTLYDPSGSDDDGDDSPNETKIKLARGILAGITAWIASTIMAGKVETEGETAPDGYAYYNDMLLPEIPNSPACNYSAIVQYLCDSSICCYNIRSSDSISLGCVSDSSKYYFSFYGPSISYYCYKLVDGRWILSQSGNRQTSMPLINWDLSGMDSYYSSLVWCSLDCYFGDELLMSSTDPVSTQTVIVEPSIYVGDLPQQIQNGEKGEDDIVLPSEIDYSKLIQDDQTLEQSITNTMSQLADGTMTYDDYLASIEPIEESVPETEPDPEPVVDPLADVSLQRFLEALGNALMDPLRWLANALLDGIRDMFVPSEDFITDKVNALRVKFAFADSIIETGQAIGTALSVGDSGPPVIYMHLQDAESDINWGGTVPALDMRWYERYKSTVDSLLSAMLWIFFAWRVFRKLPGIISGMEGDAPFEPVSDGRLGSYVSNLPRIGSTSMKRRD